MKSIYLCMLLSLAAVNIFAEMRTWTAQNGKTFVGELVSDGRGKVTLKGEDGKTISVPIDGLSEADQNYIVFHHPLKLSLKAEVEREDRDSHSYLSIHFKNTDFEDISKQLDMYAMVFSSDGKLISRDVVQSLKVISKDETMQLCRFPKEEYGREQYGSHLVMIVDAEKNIIAWHTKNKEWMDPAVQKRKLLELSWLWELHQVMQSITESKNDTGLSTTCIDRSETASRQSIPGSSDPAALIDAALDYAKSGFPQDGLYKTENTEYRHYDARVPVVLPMGPVEADEVITFNVRWGRPPGIRHIKEFREMLRFFRLPKMIFHSTGQISHADDISYRLVWQGCGTCIVGIDGKTVLNSEADSNQNGFSCLPVLTIDKPKRVTGDWIDLKKGDVGKIDIINAFPQEGRYSSLLFVQVKGKDYPNDVNGSLLLPLFSVGGLSQDLVNYVYTDACPPGTEPPEPVVFNCVSAAR